MGKKKTNKNAQKATKKMQKKAKKRKKCALLHTFLPFFAHLFSYRGQTICCTLTLTLRMDACKASLRALQGREASRKNF